MKYPPHVQRLLESLSPEQALFQRRCLAFMYGLQVIVGTLLVLTGLGSPMDLYLSKQPHMVSLHQALSNDIGAAADIVYLAACLVIALIGAKMASA